MSIASQIQRLQNAKASIKTSIENKGVEVPTNALLDTYSNYIDNISTGVTIQNGKIENYKSYDENIPAGTFVKFNINLPIEDLKTLIGNNTLKKISNVINLDDERIVIVGLDNSGFIILSLLSVVNNNITKLYTYQYGNYPSYYGTIQSIKLNNNHIALCWSTNPMYIAVVSFENNGINYIQQTSTTMAFKYNKSIGVKEDTNNYYVLTSTTDKVSGNNEAYLGVTISKSDYSISNYIKQYTNGTTLTGGGIIEKDGYFYEVEQRYIDKKLFINAINFDGNSIIVTENELISPETYFSKLIQIENNYYLIYCLNSNLNELSYLKVELNNDNVYASSTGTLITSQSSLFIDVYITFNKIGNKNLLIYKDNDTGSLRTRVITQNNNSLIIGSEVNASETTESETILYFREHNACEINNKLVICYLNNIGVYSITDNKLNNESGTGITIEKATDIIEGLTKTDVTPSTSGEVYVLDTTI